MWIRHEGVPALVGGAAGGRRRPLVDPAVAPDQQDVERDGGRLRRRGGAGSGGGRRRGRGGRGGGRHRASGRSGGHGPGPGENVGDGRDGDREDEQCPQDQDGPASAAARPGGRGRGRGRRGSRGCWLRSVPHERTVPLPPAADYGSKDLPGRLTWREISSRSRTCSPRRTRPGCPRPSPRRCRGWHSGRSARSTGRPWTCRCRRSAG